MFEWEKERARERTSKRNQKLATIRTEMNDCVAQIYILWANLDADGKCLFVCTASIQNANTHPVHRACASYKTCLLIAAILRINKILNVRWIGRSDSFEKLMESFPLAFFFLCLLYFEFVCLSSRRRLRRWKQQRQRHTQTCFHQLYLLLVRHSFIANLCCTNFGALFVYEFGTWNVNVYESERKREKARHHFNNALAFL